MLGWQYSHIGKHGLGRACQKSLSSPKSWSFEINKCMVLARVEIASPESASRSRSQPQYGFAATQFRMSKKPPTRQQAHSAMSGCRIYVLCEREREIEREREREREREIYIYMCVCRLCKRL